MRALLVAILIAAALQAAPAWAQVPQHLQPPPYPIVKPQPWLPPTYQSPRGSREHVVIPPPAPAPQSRAGVPSQLYVPQTGRTLPNLPVRPGETSQERAARCAHQAGVYGAQAGNRAAYIGTCINQ